MNKEIHEKAMKMGVEETRRVLRESGMPGPERYYNFISIEHDIPLKVAEAMLQCCVVFAGQIADPATQPIERRLLQDGFTSMWLNLAESLGIPQARMLNAIKAVVQATGELAGHCDAAIDKHFSKAGAADATQRQ